MSPPSIAVSICTFERNAGLVCLLEAVDRQRLGTTASATVSIIVVDNSPGATARAVCDQRRETSRFRLHYVHEPRRGLSVARNAGLRRALSENADLVAFIDDDEMPEPGWLAALAERLAVTGACAAIGPVRPLFASRVPSWAVQGGFFAKTPQERDGYLRDGYTSNALVDMGAVRRLNLRFEERYNFSGGEDTFFFQFLIASGGRIVAAPAAAVWESIAPDRARLAWLFRRWFRTGAVEAQLGARPDHVMVRFVSVVGMGGARILGGCLRLMRFAGDFGRRNDRMLKACYTICRGVGMVAWSFGLEHAEYGDTNYRKKPPSTDNTCSH